MIEDGDTVARVKTFARDLRRARREGAIEERARIIVWLESGQAWEALGAGDELGVSGVHADDVGNILNDLAGLLRRGEPSPDGVPS